MRTSFLDCFFEFKPPAEKILVWTLPSKLSLWFNSVLDINFNDALSDVYFGVGTSPLDYGKKNRCRASGISGLGALWLDIDLAGPLHSKEQLPESKETALKIVSNALGSFRPSSVIDSGYGLHLYWFLDQWLSITQDNRSSVQEIVRGFNAFMVSEFAQAGFALDGVHDLSRVMRLPGTKNYKIPTSPRDVSVLDLFPERRYPFDSFQFRQSQPPAPREARATKAQIKEDSAFPVDKWETLKELDYRAELTFKMMRPDLHDQSGSSYTMALGRLAHNAGWLDDEVFALLVSFRKSNKLEVKPHAIRLTIEKLHQTPSGGSQLETDCMSGLSAMIGISIAKFTRFDSTPPAYRLTLSDNRIIDVGTIEGLTDCKRFRNTVAAGVGILPKRFKNDDWDSIVRSLLRLVVHVSAGPESTEHGQCVEWLHAYLNAVTVHNSREDGLTAGEPWADDGAIFIIGALFRSWLALHLSERVELRKLCLALRSIGADPISILIGGRKCNAWKLPPFIWKSKRKEDTLL